MPTLWPFISITIPFTISAHGLALCIVSFLVISSVEYVDKEGNSISGIAAAHRLRDEKNQWSGYITEDMLSEVIKRNAEINASEEYLSRDYRENNKAYAEKQGFSDIRTMLNKAFCSFQEYDYYRADNVSADEAGSLYEYRISNLTEWLNQCHLVNILHYFG